MEMTRISIPVTIEEREALFRVAQNEMRNPREQARYIIRQYILGEQRPENANGAGHPSDKTQANTVCA